jgi:hypothetical protein
MLRVIEIDADGLDGHTFPASGVVREECPEMEILDL